jgi:hypothetical protein
MDGRISGAGRRAFRCLAVTAALALGAPAVAAAETYKVLQPHDDGGGCDGTACVTLRDALAKAQDGDTIELPDHGEPYTQGRERGEFAITSDVELVGEGADETRIVGSGARVFAITAGEGREPAAAVMRHLQVAGGFSWFAPGGNIVNYGDLTLDHVRVTGGYAFEGGGVANIGGKLVIRHSLIDNNDADYSESVSTGGGIYSLAFDEGDGVFIYDSTIAFNEAHRGGGIAARYSGQSQRPTVATFERVTLARNHGRYGMPGGLLIGENASVDAYGSLIASNTAEIAVLLRGAAAIGPSNCGQPAPSDRGDNLSNTLDCGFKPGTADPRLSDTLVEGLGETPVLTIPADSPAADLIAGCEGTDQRDLERPQGDRCDAGAFEAALPVIDAGPEGKTSDTSPTFEFSSRDPGTTFECRFDGPEIGRWSACESPATYRELTDGPYVFNVRAAGARSSASRSFYVEAATPTPTPTPLPTTVPPTPQIDSGPVGTTSDTSPSFAFSAGGAPVFECRLDGPGGAGPWEPGCVSPRTYQGLAPGSYVFHVRAAGGDPVSRAFAIAAPVALPAQTPQPTPTPTPQPVFRRSVSVKPTKGTVKVKLPGTNRYVDLESLDTIPLGASIDVRKGRVRLYSARDRRGTVQAASFYSGVFRVVQRGSVTELQLRGPKPRCGSRASASAAGEKKSKRKKARKRRLWGSGRGRFRTRGRFSAATVRGTRWLVEDSCRSTTTRVKQGVVTVRDFKRKRTIRLRAGDRYVARRR